MIRRARHFILAIILTLATWGFAAEVSAEPAPVLRQNITVQGEAVRLGDIFDGAGVDADAIVAYAPAPGRRAIFDANWLTRTAAEYGLPWKATSRLDRIAVERASTIVAQTEIEAALRDELARRGYGREYELILNNTALRIHVPVEQAATIAIESLAIQQRGERLTAVLRIPADDPAARRVNVSGRFFAVVGIPVAARLLPSGERIAAQDITVKQVRASTIQGNIVTDPAALIGLAPRRALSAGMPILATELGQPILVRRGRPVTMTFTRNNITLTATGRALDDGSLGDLIQVRNTKTLRTIDATVTGTDRVVVGNRGQLALNTGISR